MATSSSADPPASPSLASWPSALSEQSPNSPRRRHGGGAASPPHPPKGGRRSPSNDAATENCPPRKACGCLPRSSRRDEGRRCRSSERSVPPAKRACPPRASLNRAVLVDNGREAESTRDATASAHTVREGIHDGEDECLRSVGAGKRGGAESVAGGVDEGDAEEENGGVPNAGGGRKRNAGGRRKRDDGVEDAHADGKSTHESDAGVDETPLPNGYVPKAPPKVETADEAVRQMLGLLGFPDAIDQARSEEEKKHAIDLRAVLEKYLRLAFAEGTYNDIFNDLRPLVWGRGPGLYALLFNINALLKVGMSARDRMVRAKEQWHKMAFDLCDMKTLNELIPDDSQVLQAILKLMPPGLRFHEDKREQMLAIIKMQIAELMVASLYKMSTGTAGERLMQWPSKSVQKLTTLRPAESYSANDLSFFDGVVEYLFRLTWSTYSYDLIKRAEAGDKVLSRLLRGAPLDRFSKLHLLRRGFGLGRVPKFQDALEDSVRTVEMRGIIADLGRLLDLALVQLQEHGTISIETAQQIRDVVAAINRESDNYKHYKEPAMQRLVDAAVPMMKTTVEECKAGEAIVWERTMYDAIEKCAPEAFKEIIPPNSSVSVEVVEGYDYLLRITTVLPGGKIVKHLIIRSFFRIIAEETSLAVRKSVLKAYIELLSYLAAGKQITREHAEREAAIMQSFLMELEGFKGSIDDEVDGSFRAARSHHVGEGIAVGGVPKNVMSLSRFLRIGYLEMLDIFSSLGRERFHVFLNVFGVKAGSDNLTPLDADFSCPGVETVAHLEARPCPHNGCEEEDRPYVYLAGKDIADFSLELKFRCHTCAKSVYDREKIHLAQRIESQDASITDPQRQRTEKAAACRERKNERRNEKYRNDSAYRDQKIETERTRYQNDSTYREQKKANSRQQKKRNRERTNATKREKKAEERKNGKQCHGDPNCGNDKTWTGYCMTCFNNIQQRTGSAPTAVKKWYE